jgi:hypothetical protein
MWWFYVLHGLGHAHNLTRSTAETWRQTTKVVFYEQCGRSYAYELKRTGQGSADRFNGGHSAAVAQAEENLSWALYVGIDLVPCPACGWYQRHMIPKARRLHRRWMVYVGQCLTIGLIPVAIIGGIVNHINREQGGASVPWPTFVCGRPRPPSRPPRFGVAHGGRASRAGASIEAEHHP